MQSKQQGDDGDGHIEAHANLSPVARGYHRRVQILEHLAELSRGYQGDGRPRQQHEDAQAERKAALRA